MLPHCLCLSTALKNDNLVDGIDLCLVRQNVRRSVSTVCGIQPLVPDNCARIYGIPFAVV